MSYSSRLLNCVAYAVGGDSLFASAYDEIVSMIGSERIGCGVTITVTGSDVIIMAGVTDAGSVFCNINTLH